ncbi:porin family protein [Prevotella herbatica]|uniref:Porin family protein n=1 Tax=Prevotella herbatica TaxID=2801997 RepID=A0ABM7NV36_9BACT|nr:outer membrane beta-barrel protein [Prevotella herbatica]BCS84291.1 porin family protein [Prevotella herbatica]
MKDQWINDIKDRIRDSNRKAPESLLDDIKREMERRGIAPARSKKAHTVSMWTLRSAIAVAAMSVAFILYNYKNNYNNNDNIKIANNNKETQVNEIVKKSDNNLLNYKKKGNIILRISNNVKKGIELISKDIDANKDASINKENLIAQTTTTTKETENDTSQKKISSNKNYTGQVYNDYKYEYHHSKNHESELRVSTYYSGIMNGYSNSQNGVMLANAYYYGDSSDKMVNDNKYYAIYSNNELTTETKHHQPIKLGVSINYKINDRWSLQTGFTYSYLSSDFTINSHGEDNIKEQKLHYVGLPLSASYSIWHNNAINIYATAGGEAEKLVNGKAKTTHDANGTETYSTTENIKSNRLLFSTNAAAGIEYKADKSLSLYAEPGISYHFKNGSGIKNIYTENPFNFNLNIGIRININK